MIRSAEAFARKNAGNREYQRRLRAERRAAGLNAKGQPRQRAPVIPHHQTPEHSRALGLEAILWMATKKWRQPAYLIGLHTYAATLPVEWWIGRAQCSIARLVEVLEAQRQQNFQVAA